MEYIRRRFIAFLASFALCLPATVFAVDGVILIDQNKAIAGNVTPGDAPGFPVTISQPGSYRLSGNLVVPDQNTTAIEVRAENVSIDLNGFGIYGLGLPGQGAGIRSVFVGQGTTARFNFAAVSNGTITGVGDSAVTLSSGALVSNMRIHNNGGFGVSVDLGRAIIMNNIVADNREGINAGPRSVVRANTVSGVGLGGRLSVVCPATFVGNYADLVDIFQPLAGCTRDQNAPAP